MDLKKRIEKDSDWKVTTNQKKVEKEVVKSAYKSPISFSEVRNKYVTAVQDSVRDQASEGIDKKWVSAFIKPKNAEDSLGRQKVKFYNENGEEMASQG